MEVSKELIIKCKNYDKPSLVQLFHQYEKYLYKICFSYSQNEQDSLDLVQEIYIKVFNNISKFNESMPFHPWIRRIAVNTCINFKRDRNPNVISINSKINEDTTIEDKLASEDRVEKTMEEAEVRDIIKNKLTELPEQYRIIILLRYYEDLSYDEIGDLLNIPMGTVKNRIYRAKSILGKSLKGELEAGL
ncbi:MAG: RNA polymerase sigma factor [Solirubrobacterales bacterium]